MIIVKKRETGEEDLPASIQRLEDNIQKHEGILDTAIRNNTNDTKTSGTTIIRKQKWEEKQIFGRFKQLTNVISMAMKSKPYERNWISPNCSTKQRLKD